MTVSAVDAAHLLRRSGFGARAADIAELAAMDSIDQAVDRVLDISRNPSTDDIPVGVDPPTSAFSSWFTLTGWWLERMRTSPVPIVEKLTLFWHNHFVSSLAAGFGDMGLMAQQHQTIRANATGDFHALAQALAIDPQMVLYLDNAFNVSTRPQENFARELMELFTLGPDQYTQDDVVSMARAWTGHSLAAGWRTYAYFPNLHYKGPSSLFGTTKVWDGPAALTEVLKGAKSERAARFIAAKLFSYLAYAITPEDPVVDDLAQQFRTADLDILALVRAIFRSDAFWSDEARHALVRSPIEWFVAGTQALDIPMSVAQPQWWLPQAGQSPFFHPDVSGWKQGDYWLCTAGGWARSSWAYQIRTKVYLSDTILAGLETLSTADAVDRVFDQFGIVAPSAGSRSALEAMCDQCRTEGSGWIVRANLAMLALLCPEFQVA